MAQYSQNMGAVITDSLRIASILSLLQHRALIVPFETGGPAPGSNLNSPAALPGGS